MNHLAMMSSLKISKGLSKAKLFGAYFSDACIIGEQEKFGK